MLLFSKLMTRSGRVGHVLSRVSHSRCCCWANLLSLWRFGHWNKQQGDIVDIRVVFCHDMHLLSPAALRWHRSDSPIKMITLRLHILLSFHPLSLKEQVIVSNREEVTCIPVWPEVPEVSKVME